MSTDLSTARPLPSTAAPPAPEPQADVARTAGRGGLAVAGAKVWFIVTGFVQQIALPRIVGLDGYGALSSVQAIANIPNNVVVTCSIQGVSRAVAGAGAAAEASAFRRALRVHAVLAPAIALLFFACAPTVATLQRAPHLLGPLRVFSVVLLVYGVYAPLVGSLNGRRRFVHQAALDVTSATLRTFAVLAAAWAAWRAGADPVLGASVGIATAAVLVLAPALRLAGTGVRGDAGPTPAQHLAILLPLAAAQLFLNLLMQADISLLRPLAHEAGLTAGLAGEALLHETDKLVGAYRAAQLFAFLPYQLLLSITFILFPMLAKARAEEDREAMATYVRTGVRLATVLAGLFVSVSCGLAPLLLRFAFPAGTDERAGDALRVLALGQGAFTLFGIEANVLGSLGKERWSAAITALAAVAVAALCAGLVPGTAFGPAILLRTATATSAALLVASIAGAGLVRRAAGAFVAPAVLARVLASLAVAALLGSRMPWLGRVVFPLQALAVAGAYALVLVATGEIGRADLALVRRALGRRAAG